MAAQQSPYGGIIASGWQTLLIAFKLILDTKLFSESSIGSPGMNVFDAKVNANIANLQGNEIKLDKNYKSLSGKVELGIRPEFIELCEDGKGIKIEIIRIEDVAHHKIVRAKYNNRKVNIIVPEDIKITPTMSSITFKPKGINIYVDDWLVEGELS